MLEALNKIDTAILIWVHDHHNNIFDLFMPFVTDADNWILPILVLIFYLGIKGQKRGKITLVLLIIALALADSICAQLLKPFFERIRPSHYGLEGLHLLVSKGGKWSMPSNHAANMFSLAIVLSYFYKKYKPLLFLLAILISFSRVYVGVHFPGDVIVGGLIGFFISTSFLILWGKIKLHELD